MKLNVSLILKVLGIVSAGFAAFSGPGIPPRLQTWVIVAGATLTAVIHGIDSIYNTPKGAPPG